MSVIGKMYSPYQKFDSDTMVDYYNLYLKDEERYIEKDEELFSKIIYRCEFYHKEGYWFLITFEALKSLKKGDILIDELGNEFFVDSFEMIRFSGEIPEWYFKTVSVLVKANNYDIGSYLHKKDIS